MKSRNRGDLYPGPEKPGIFLPRASAFSHHRRDFFDGVLGGIVKRFQNYVDSLTGKVVVVVGEVRCGGDMALVSVNAQAMGERAPQVGVAIDGVAHGMTVGG